MIGNISSTETHRSQSLGGDIPGDEGTIAEDLENETVEEDDDYPSNEDEDDIEAMYGDGDIELGHRSRATGRVPAYHQRGQAQSQRKRK